MRRAKIKKPIIDGIQFDSQLEWEVYSLFMRRAIHLIPWLEDLEWYEIIDTRPPEYVILPKFYAGNKLFRALKYTPDFIIKKWNHIVVVEVKSKWTATKPDYRLRIKLFLHRHWEKLNFVELIQHNKKRYELIKYYNEEHRT